MLHLQIYTKFAIFQSCMLSAQVPLVSALNQDEFSCLGVAFLLHLDVVCETDSDSLNSDIGTVCWLLHHQCNAAMVIKHLLFSVLLLRTASNDSSWCSSS